jgi:hypothetical protein
MPTNYRSAPSMQCNAPSKAFPTAPEALRHARKAADAFQVGYQVYEVQDGRPRRLGTFQPSESPRRLTLDPKENHPCNP